MNKKGVSTLLEFIIGLVIVIIAVILLLKIFPSFILLGKESPDQQRIFFNELNTQIKNLNINSEMPYLFQLDDNYLLISFNNNENSNIKADSKLLSFEGTVYDAIKDITIKKPSQYEKALCLCKTKTAKYLFEDDCLQEDDICVKYEEYIKNGDEPFFLFGKTTKSIKVKKTADKINIEYE
jgi:hypothetical protein